ncbi:MAG: biotin--[acetyl-CoA-carboxylase] ligase [Saprospiraceae bacterium]|nr:biotin--[acetyl-CoA-carboxylase] ligase [Saprospiraceae bacterium]
MAIYDINNTLFLGKIWKHFEELPSTNDFLSNSGINPDLSVFNQEGVVVTTFNQTAGRGQMGNHWLAEPNQNLAYSIRLQPSFLQAHEQFHFNKIVALAVHDLIDSTLSNPQFPMSNANKPSSVVKRPTVKWANDIYINDKKVCGILIQNSLLGSRLNASIIGIGININQTIFPKDLNATSLSLETEHVFELLPFVEQLTQRLEHRYLQLKARKDFTKIHEEYLSKMYRFGVDAIFRRAIDDSVFMGKIVGVSPTGQLEIMSNRGIEVFDIKEVKFEI